MNNLAMRISNLTKIYHLYDKPQDRLKEALNPFKKTYHHDFYALKEVSFNINKGETIGIIGKNGAGKSTLLKVITGVLTASSGTVEVNGKIASLLELGAGFNPEMSGLDNIYLNGTIMGFTSAEMDKRVNAIIDFADIGEFIHQPVKMYSSGMFARLAFSVAINVEPDILIVDEALSVGDMAFQIKCFKKFEEFQENNKTILFVTHALDSVIRHCSRVLVIDNGQLITDTTPKDGVDVFKRILTGSYYNQLEKVNKTDKDEINLKNDIELNKNSLVYGNEKVEILDYCVFDNNLIPANILDFNSEFEIYMKIKFNEIIIDPIFAFTIKDAKGLEITGTNTNMKFIETGTYIKNELIEVKFKQKANLQVGKYALSLGCVNFTADGLEVYQRLYDAVFIDVIGSEQMVGFYDLRSDISLSRCEQ